MRLIDADAYAFPGDLENEPTIDVGGKWIPVTERLPEKEDGKVLVTDGIQVNFSYRNHFYRDQGGTLRVPANYGHGMNVTHWMPLPEPPERSDAE
jgi:hypothetical protein